MTCAAFVAPTGRRLIDFSAKLGGENPMLVLADADLAKTVEGAGPRLLRQQRP